MLVHGSAIKSKKKHYFHVAESKESIYNLIKYICSSKERASLICLRLFETCTH